MLKGRKVLVIDNEPLFVEAVSMLLEDEGMEVITTTDGRAGLELAERHRPDAIVSNFHMPDMDGLEVFRRLRANPATQAIPFLFITSDPDASVRERCVADGADAFLEKEFKANELVETIDRLVG